jgi:hypothetical protein
VENLLEALKNTFLIRAELNSFGGNSYEISHDTLLEPIQATKRERLALENEARLAAEAVAAKIENERIATQLAHEQAQKAELEAALKKTDEALEKAHSAIKTTERFTRIAVAVAFVAVGLGISAATLYFYANQQTRIAQEQTSIAQKNEQKSQNSLIEINVKEYIATGDGFANSKLIEEARAEYEKAAKKIDDIKPIDNKDTRVSLRKEVEVRLKELITE